MTTLVLIDDEPLIKKGLRYCIDWEANDIKIIGEASNGEEGYKLALSKKPDIIITDIKMPIMDGILMSKKIKTVLPNTKILLLSGYDDKEYLLAAIENKIDGYIFKESSADIILESVLKLQKELHKNTEKYEIEESKSELVSSNYNVLYQHTINEFFNNELSFHSFIHQAELLEINFSKNDYYTPLLLLCENLVDSNKINQTFFYLSNYQFFICKSKDKYIRALVKTDDINFFISKLSTSLNTLFVSLIGKNKIKIDQSPSFFNKSKKYETSLFWFKIGTNVFLEDLSATKKLEVIELLEIEDKILSSYKTQSPDFFLNLDEHFQLCSNNLLDLEVYKKSISRIITPILRDQKKFEELDFTLNLIKTMSNPFEVFDLMKKQCNLMQQHSQNRMILRVLNYINKNYSGPISLDTLANEGGISQTYLCKLFKDEIGLTITEYIRKIRISNAKKLLEDTNQRVNEIAYKVGYQNYKSFSSCFLKETNTNPRAYRKSILKNNNTIK